MALACLLGLAGLLTAAIAFAAFTHPFVSEFTGSDTPDGSLGSTADKIAVRQSNGNVYVIDKTHTVVDIFDASGAYVSQVDTSSLGGDPDIAVDNSGTGTEGRLYVLPEFGPLSAYDASGTLLYQLNGSNTPNGSFGDVCGTAVDSSGNVYVSDYSNSAIYKFDSSGNYLASISVGFSPCDIAVDTDGTIYAIDWTQAVHKLDSTGVDQGIIDSQSPRAVSVDPSTHHVYVVHDTSVIEYDTSGGVVDNFGSAQLQGSRGADINASTGTVYVSSNPPAGGRVAIFGIGAPTLVVTTGDATNVTGSSATLNGHVDQVGVGDVTDCHFEYGTDTTYGNSVPCAQATPIADPTDVSADISGLSESTTYHFILVATTASAGTVQGVDKTFQTPGPPSTTTGAASNLTDTTATLNGTVTPNGGDTTCQFQYVDDAAFQATGYSTATAVDCSPADVGSGFTPQPVSADIAGLTPASTYHFRVVATNGAGTTEGDDATFETKLSFLRPIDSFGSPGTHGGQFQGPVGMAIDQRTGFVYVADAGNARIEVFNARSHFRATWGWGVTDGQSKSEVCRSTKGCQAGVPGSGAGQFVFPTSVAVDPSSRTVYVGDAGTNLVQKFSRTGIPLATIDGSTTPQGPFVALAGIAVDQNGNLWTADVGTGNVDEFDSHGTFVQQWSQSSGGPPSAIAVDATNDAVYLLQFGTTNRYTQTGANGKQIDAGSGVALGLNPLTGDLYVDHGHDVAIYDHTGARIDTLFSLGATTNSQGVAVRAKGRKNNGSRRDLLYVSDNTNDVVTVYGPPAPGKPAITSESDAPAGATSRLLSATVVPLGRSTTCTFQYVLSSDFAATGYQNATTVPCTPSRLGSNFAYQHPTATLTGLTLGAFYHYRVVATNAAGTATGPDQTFQAGPGLWTPFSRCPVDDPIMLAADGVNTEALCVNAHSLSGSLTIGTFTVPTGGTDLQFGVVFDQGTGVFTIVPPPAGAIMSDPVTFVAANLTITGVVEAAGPPSNFDLVAGISQGQPIITVPVKFHLINDVLGPNCYIGSDQNPILLHPENTDISGLMGFFESFDPTGASDPNGPLATLVVSGLVQGDDTFAVPGSSGCGQNGSLNAVVDAVAGLPTPSGSNHLVLDEASSALAIPATVLTGQDFANDWHIGFGM